MKTTQKRYLVFSDGTVYEGLAFGADAAAVGELVFTTGMCGYIETLTDPSYYGQIVVQTFPLIGNYGFIEEDMEGECAVSGYVVREWCETPSNFRSQYDIDRFLKDRHIPGIYGLDTREITQKLREHGVMNAMICDAVPADLTPIRTFRIRDAIAVVTGKLKSPYIAVTGERYRVTLIDYGAKMNIIRELQLRGCTVTVVPASTTAEQVLSTRPDGVVLSNGPGDPAENKALIAELAKLAGRVPLFGICLGHQLLALALGGKTMKLPYGHRGTNQPVREVGSHRTYITAQNHGYAVVSDSVSQGKVSYINANDGTCEGVDYPELRAFTIQFHPEVCSGPKDTTFLFDRFISLIGGGTDAT
ncbi:MAG: carbamoyl phosphate synthase small subunit [Eubacteriales bacterium]